MNSTGIRLAGFRILFNNFLIPGFEFAWFTLGYYGFLNFLISGSSGPGFELDWGFLVLSQGLIAFLTIFVISRKKPSIFADKHNVFWYYLSSSLGGVGTVVYLSLEWQLSWISMTVFCLGYYLVYGAISVIVEKFVGGIFDE